MNKINQLLTLFIFVCVTLFLSCSNPCSDPCVNGECIRGDCECEEGYEGVECNTNLNTKFLGIYTMKSETCTVSGIISVPYRITISASFTEPTNPIFLNILGLVKVNNTLAFGTINSNGVDFSFSNSVFGFFGKNIDGSGSIDASNNTIQFTYILYDSETGEILDECTATFERV